MRVSKDRVLFIVLPLIASFLAYSSGSARTERPRQSSPQAPSAQSSPQAAAEPAQQSDAPRPRRTGSQRQTPCWSLAGIAPQLVNQRWRIEDNAKGSVTAVCKDPALTAEKKREKIQEINEQTERDIEKIIPAKQFEAFKACQSKRDQEIANRQEPKPQKQLGPCGGVIPAQPSTSQKPHEHQPANPNN